MDCDPLVHPEARCAAQRANRGVTPSFPRGTREAGRGEGIGTAEANSQVLAGHEQYVFFLRARFFGYRVRIARASAEP